MAAKQPLGVGIIGCGNIARGYADNLAGYAELVVRGVTDIDGAKAEQLAAEYALPTYPDLDALLDDAAVDIAVNLTTHHAHHEVTSRCLKAGKHVYSEKPLALAGPDGRDLVELADSAGLRLGCSPAVFMGEAQQTAMKAVRGGELGKVRVIYAEANWGSIEAWHPAPQAFYAVGPLFDVGVYPLTMATAMFGPARRIWAYGRVAKPERLTQAGEPFTLTAPEFVTVIVELEEGCVMRLTATFYVGRHSKQQGMEFHGDDGSLHLADWQQFDAVVEQTEAGAYRNVPLVREAYHGIEWGRGVRDLGQAILEGRPHRASGAQAAHVVEVLSAAVASMETGQPIAVTSTFEPPAPMDWS